MDFSHFFFAPSYHAVCQWCKPRDGVHFARATPLPASTVTHPPTYTHNVNYTTITPARVLACACGGGGGVGHRVDHRGRGSRSPDNLGDLKSLCIL